MKARKLKRDVYVLDGAQVRVVVVDTESVRPDLTTVLYALDRDGSVLGCTCRDEQIAPHELRRTLSYLFLEHVAQAERQQRAFSFHVDDRRSVATEHTGHPDACVGAAYESQ